MARKLSSSSYSHWKMSPRFLSHHRKWTSKLTNGKPHSKPKVPPFFLRSSVKWSTLTGLPKVWMRSLPTTTLTRWPSLSVRLCCEKDVIIIIEFVDTGCPFICFCGINFLKTDGCFSPYHSFSTTMSNQFCVWLCRLFVSQHLSRENLNSMALNVLTSNSLISQNVFPHCIKNNYSNPENSIFCHHMWWAPFFSKVALCGSVLPTLIGTFLLPKDHAKMRLLFACQENCHDNLIPMVLKILMNLFSLGRIICWNVLVHDTKLRDGRSMHAPPSWHKNWWELIWKNPPYTFFSYELWHMNSPPLAHTLITQ